MKRSCLGIILICVIFCTCACSQFVPLPQKDSRVNSADELSEEKGDSDNAQEITGSDSGGSDDARAITNSGSGGSDDAQAMTDSGSGGPDNGAVTADSDDAQKNRAETAKGLNGSEAGNSKASTDSVGDESADLHSTEAPGIDEQAVYALLGGQASELKKQYGLMAENGSSSVYYTYEEFGNNLMSLEDKSYGEGLLFTDIYDYDHDNVPELLSVRRQSGAIEYNDGVSKDRSEYILEMFEAGQDKCQLKDSIKVGAFDIINPFMGWSNMTFFRHETDVRTDLCIENIISAQDMRAGSALITLHYDGDALSFVDGIKYGPMVYMEPASEKAIEYLLLNDTSSAYYWDPVIVAESYEDTRCVGPINEKLNKMGFEVTKTRADVQEEYLQSEEEPEDTEIQEKVYCMNASEFLAPIEGSCTLLAFLSEEVDYRRFFGNDTDEIGLIHNVSDYTGEGNSHSRSETYDAAPAQENTDDNTDSVSKNDNEEKGTGDEVYDYVISQLHGLWYSNTMGENGPESKMICEGNDFNGEIKEIVEYDGGYLVRIVDGYSYYFGPELDSCMFVDGWETTADNCYGTSGWWKPNEEQRKEYGD